MLQRVGQATRVCTCARTQRLTSGHRYVRHSRKCKAFLCALAGEGVKPLCGWYPQRRRPATVHIMHGVHVANGTRHTQSLCRRTLGRVEGSTHMVSTSFGVGVL